MPGQLQLAVLVDDLAFDVDQPHTALLGVAQARHLRFARERLARPDLLGEPDLKATQRGRSNQSLSTLAMSPAVNIPWPTPMGCQWRSQPCRRGAWD